MSQNMHTLQIGTVEDVCGVPQESIKIMATVEFSQDGKEWHINRWWVNTQPITFIRSLVSTALENENDIARDEAIDRKRKEETP